MPAEHSFGEWMGSLSSFDCRHNILKQVSSGPCFRENKTLHGSCNLLTNNKKGPGNHPGPLSLR